MIPSPTYKLVEGTQTITVKPSTEQIRPFVCGAILRGMVFTPEIYTSFMELQDQLHRNVCRQRTLVAIGTHDLDTVEGPFTYDARAPNDISFVPLTHETEFKAGELLELYATDPECKHLKPYVPIIQSSPVYPVIEDAQNRVLSLPPIINGNHSKISLNTKNVLIECTGTDLTKVNIVLDTMLTMFGQYTSPVPYTVERLQVNYESTNISKGYSSPEMQLREMTAGVEFCNSLIGINLTGGEMVELCEKVQLGPAKLGDVDGEEMLTVTVPPTRSDILHAVDVAEDIGVAFGFNNIVKKVPKTCTVGGEQPLNKLGDLLREEISRAGYTEVLTHGLASIHDNFTALRLPTTPAVSLSNPANIDYQVVRTTLLPGLLLTLKHNKSASFTSGFKLFEISDVVLRDDDHVVCDSIVGARNARRICAVYAGPTSGFEIVHGLVDRIMTLCEICPETEYVSNSLKKGSGSDDNFADEEEKCRVTREGWYYRVVEGDDSIPTYFEGRSAHVLMRSPNTNGDEIRVGTFGILHPEVLNTFDILYPATSMELDLEALLW
uniref:phenylalanine--tRNA ligase n=1 Tax=Proboscia inermis TaxID=420281 RepID=A0A7S0BVS6_9STRA